MGRAFSCIVLRDCTTYWKVGLDFHDLTLEEFGLTYLDKPQFGGGVFDPDKVRFARVEVRPSEKIPFGYFRPELPWLVNITSDFVPTWFNDRHDLAAQNACKDWKKIVYDRINLKEAITPINPLLVSDYVLTLEDLKDLAAWSDVWESAWKSTWVNITSELGETISLALCSSMTISCIDIVSTIGTYFDGSLAGNINSLAWHVVEGLALNMPMLSVWAAVGAYGGSLIKHDNYYTYQPCVNLWKRGFVPSFDGKTWRIHQGKFAKVILELDKGELDASCRTKRRNITTT